jgi:dipeptidyl aminopeptidase/acylaminoacyl peptidase
MNEFNIQSYLNVRSAHGPSFSPDGRFLSFLSNITGVAQLWRVPISGGWPTQLTFANDTVRAAHYNPRRHELIFAMDAGGNERTQLYLLRGVGSGTDHDIGEGWISEDISKHPQAIHDFGGWSHEGDQLAFSANREDPGRFDIYIERAGDPQAKQVARGPGGYYSVRGWSPDDRSLLIYRMESSANQDVFVLDLKTNQTTHITPHRGNAQYHTPCWSADGKSIYCATTAEGRDLAGLAQIDIASKKLTYLETPDHEIETVALSPKGRWLAWTLNVDGRTELKVKDQKDGKVQSPPALPLGVISSLDFSQDESRVAFTFDGSRHNMDVWVWDPQSPPVNRLTGRPALRQVTHSSRAGLPLSQFTEPELIYYPTFDGRKIPAWFYKPAEKGDRLPPVIVHPHGGPEGQSRPIFNALLQYFIDRGYGILAPNARGSTGYGTTYMDLDNTTKRMDSVADLTHAAYWLRDQKQGDPKRLAVYGGSYGGFMVLAAVTHYPDLWAAGIDVVGICNFVTFLEKTGAYRRGHREAEYGNLREHRAFFEKISPIHHVNKIRCPMMVIHGANDPRVPIEEAEQIVAALRQRKIPVEYLRYADEGHGLVKLKNRLDAYPRMAAFLDKYLK